MILLQTKIGVYISIKQVLQQGCTAWNAHVQFLNGKYFLTIVSRSRKTMKRKLKHNL